jgi:general secretion pathway protein D
LRALLVQLDTPPRQVLVEITIAEVTLSDETRFGIEWFLQAAFQGGDLTIDTRGGLSREPGGLGATFTRAFSTGTVTAALNAIAQNTNLNILSTPRLVARSGSEAQILIGSDVPIITSQRAAESESDGDTDILQTVQYRQTGVILNMRPVVYGADRVDIELYQEVSSQQPNRTSEIDSPIILNRSVTTQLSLREGMTAVIGGLIQDSYTREQRGIPLLKDIPILGQAFRVDSTTGGKTELLILVTPYILRNDQNVAQAASTYSRAMNRLLDQRGPQVYTLLPWHNIFDKTPRAHGGRLITGEPIATTPDAPQDP